MEWRAVEETGSHEGRKIVTFGGSVPRESAFPTVDPSTQTVSFPIGLSMGVLGEGITIGDVLFPSIGALLRAYKKDSDVHILSTPTRYTQDWKTPVQSMH